MTVSEILADLNGRPHTAQVIMHDADGMGHVYVIESVLKEGNERVVFLVGKEITKRHPLEAHFAALVEEIEQGKSRNPHKAEFHKSEKDGTYQVTIDGTAVRTGIGSEAEAKGFAVGYVFGFEMGSAGKGLNAADLSGV